MSYGVGCRCGSDPASLWLWCRPAAVAPIQPWVWELPYATDAALKSKRSSSSSSSKCVLEANRTRIVLWDWEEGALLRDWAGAWSPPTPAPHHAPIPLFPQRESGIMDPRTKTPELCHFPCSLFLLSPILPITFPGHKMVHGACG